MYSFKDMYQSQTAAGSCVVAVAVVDAAVAAVVDAAVAVAAVGREEWDTGWDD